MRTWQTELLWMLQNMSPARKGLVALALLFGIALLSVAWPWVAYTLVLSILTIAVSGFLSAPSRVVLALSPWMYTYYCAQTKLTQRNIDAYSHIEYIQHILHQGTTPPGYYCLVCHHPPLYQTFAAPFYWMAELVPGLDPAKIVQCLSIPLVLGFCLACAGIMERSISRPWLASLGTAICALWPYNIIMSARVHNDVMASLLMAWTMLATLAFYQEPSRKKLVYALGLAGASILTKMSGLVMFALVAGTCIARALLSREEESTRRKGMSRFKQQFRPWLAPLALSLLGIASYLSLRDRTVFDNDSAPVLTAQGPQSANAEAKGGAGIFGSAYNIATELKLNQSPIHYLYLDVKDLIENPYAPAKVSGAGGALFWNHFIKSSLFSTYNRFPDGATSYRLNQQIASLLIFIELLLIAQTLLFAATRPLRYWRKQWVVGSSTILLLSAALAFCILEPASHHADFRHVFPILISFLTLFLLSVEDKLNANNTWSVVSIAMALLFTFLSATYFIPKSDWRFSETKSGPVYLSQERMTCSTQEHEDGELIYRARLEWGQSLHINFGALQSKFQEFELITDGSDSYDIEIVGSGGIEKQTLERANSLPIGNLGHRNQFLVPKNVGTVESLIIHPKFGDHMFGIGCIHIVGDK